MDHRIYLTLNIIQDAFQKLLSTKEIDSLTIKEICQEANISRATFYSHYTEIYALFLQNEKILFFDRFHKTNPSLFRENAYLSDFSSNEMDSVFLSISLNDFLVYLHENAFFYNKLLSIQSKSISNSCIHRYFELRLKNKWFSSFHSETPISDYGFLFYRDGILSILNRWLENPDRESPAVFEITLYRIINLKPDTML